LKNAWRVDHRRLLGLQQVRREARVDKHSISRLQHARHLGQTLLQPLNKLRHVAAAHNVKAFRGLLDFLDNRLCDLDSPFKASFSHSHLGPLEVPIDRIKAHSLSGVCLHKPDEVGRVAATYIENPASRPQIFTSDIETSSLGQHGGRALDSPWDTPCPIPRHPCDW
jgi:hypothetical protein